MNTDTHTYTRTLAITYTCTRKYTHMHTYTHAYSCHSHAYVCRYTHAYLRTHTYTRTLALTYLYINTDIHTHTDTCTHSPPYTYTYIATRKILNKHKPVCYNTHTMKLTLAHTYFRVLTLYYLPWVKERMRERDREREKKSRWLSLLQSSLRIFPKWFYLETIYSFYVGFFHWELYFIYIFTYIFIYIYIELVQRERGKVAFYSVHISPLLLLIYQINP